MENDNLNTDTTTPGTGKSGSTNLPEEITVIGLGGIGAIVARYLSVFLDYLPSYHTLRLVDGDKYDVGNKNRQVFTELGFKASILADEIDLFCDNLIVDPVCEFIGPENSEDIIPEGGFVLSCVDHHGVRRFIAERCEELSNITLISGGNDGVEDGKRGTYGNIQVFIRKEGEDLSPPITALHPEIAEASMEDAPLGKKGCGIILPSVPQILFANMAVASMMLNSVYSISLGEVKYQEVHVDILEAMMRPQEVMHLTKEEI